MKKILIVIMSVNISAFGQTFTSSPSASIPNLTTITDDLVVSGIGTIDCTFGLEQVCIDISHNRDADMEVFLIDPSGGVYELTTDNGGNGNNYTSTCFDMTSVSSVQLGSAPFTGTFLPEGDFSLANTGQDADGTWTLEVTDDRAGQSGTLNEWSLEFSSTPPCPPAPTAEDCGGGTTVCTDETFTGNSSGNGNFSDLNGLNQGCLFGENQSSWYYFQAFEDGDFAFIIETSVDYDFAVWGPMTEITCPPVGSPIRCSYSGAGGDTGLQNGAGDLSENAFGDGVVDPINAITGEIYIILVDNFTSDGSSFDLVWDLSGGAILDCTPLPVELIDFTVKNNGGANLIEWNTASELNCANFRIERSVDGVNWEVINEVAGSGNSSVEIAYQFIDFYKRSTINYYRLFQLDFDGEENYLGVISIDNSNDKQVVKIINLMGAEVREDYDGIKVYVYSDGTQRKIVSQN